MGMCLWWRTVKSELCPAAYKCTCAVSGSSRHFCTAPRNASHWRSQSQVNAGLHQPSFPAPKPTHWTLQGEKSMAEVSPLTWPISVLLQRRYCALNCCASEDGFWSAKAARSAGFCLGGCWPAGQRFQGSYSRKHTKPEVMQKSRTVTTGTQDSWGKPEHCACAWRSICSFSSFYCV